MGNYSNSSYSADAESTKDVTPSEPVAEKDASPAEPETVAPGSETEGVKTGDLRFVPNQDGTRHYTDQQPVETTGDPKPTPEENPTGEKPAEAAKTNEPVGR